MGACAAMAVLVLLLVIYMVSKPVPMAGTKEITIDVIYEDGTTDRYQASTDAHFLLEAVDTIPELTVDGSTTEQYGLMVTVVNGKRAEFQKDKAYWSILVDGEPCNYGITNQPIKNGEHYVFQYTTEQAEGMK